MKNKYQRLSKEEKKEAIKEYRAESEKNTDFIHQINKMFVLGIIGAIYGVLAVAFDFIYPQTKIWSYIVDNIVLIFSIFLIIQRNRFLVITMNNYLINKDDNKKELKEIKKTSKKTSKKKSK